MSDETKLPSRQCGERLYLDGELHAVCTQPWGTEHSHCDVTADVLVRLNLARRATPSDEAPHRTNADQDTRVADHFSRQDMPPFSAHELHSDNRHDLKTWVDRDELVGLVEERNGGIIGYINRAHYDRILGLLALAACVIEQEQKK